MNLRTCVSALLLFAAPVSGLLSASLLAQSAPRQTENIIYVMTDGLRWQEVFTGADEELMNLEHGKVKDADLAALKAKWLRNTPEDRRALLMPFLWSTVGQHGQIYGNETRGSDAHVTNTLNFSYPGYSETLCGFPDPRIQSNDKIPNPNQTVLEWLNNKPAYHGNVAAFAAWDVFPSIFNSARSGLLVNAGYDPLLLDSMTPRLDLLNHMKAETPRFWEDEPFDPIPFYTAIEYLKAKKPRILYLSLGDTDDWAHDGNYSEYLNAAHRADQYLHDIWETVQSMPEYRGHTTLIFSTDHGRGAGLDSWKSHGPTAAYPEKKWPGLPESQFIWLAFLGPDTKPLGERTNIPAVTQNQIAATVARFLGQDYNSAVPKAGPPITDVLPK